MTHIGIESKLLEIKSNKKIEILRVLNGWTQQQAAEKCGTNAKVFWLWEKGLNVPRENSKRAIARAFDVTVEEIFNE